MIFKGMLRVRNEARWIEQVLCSLRPLCMQTHVLDDHSTDDTVKICQSIPGVVVHHSPFESFHEVRDKDYLLARIVESGPSDWIVHVDGDEELEQNGPERIRTICEAATGHQINALALRVMYLWNDKDLVRVDGIYGRFRRPSVFRTPASAIGFASEQHNTKGLHCTNVPASYLPFVMPTDVKLWHWGYFDREMRVKKHAFYNRIDPGNAYEDRYRHVVAGDVPEVPAHITTLHAGPLTLVDRSQV